MAVKILVAEDEPEIRQLILNKLNKVGMSGEPVDSVDAAETALMTGDYDLLILDRMLRGEDSLKKIDSFKRKRPNQKILVLSGKTAVEDRISGLDNGADDYLPKPFDMDELIARIRALVRRESPEFKKDSLIEYEDVLLDLNKQILTRHLQNIPISQQEFKILALLMRSPGRVFDKTELLERVWSHESDPQSNVVEAAMARLRAKINQGHWSELIHTKRGAGYWFGKADS